MNAIKNIDNNENTAVSVSKHLFSKFSKDLYTQFNEVPKRIWKCFYLPTVEVKNFLLCQPVGHVLSTIT